MILYDKENGNFKTTLIYQIKHGGMGYIKLKYIVHASVKYAYALEISEHSRKSKKR